MERDDLGTPHLRFERRKYCAWVRIDRPDARNALTAGMYYGIRRAVDIVNASRSLRALVITGSGDVFAPGGEMGGRHDDSEVDVGGLMGNDVLPFRAIRDSRAPVVAAVNGLCSGGGLTIAMLADITVASDRARFRAPELLRGVADTWYASLLPAHIGTARAREFMMTARWMEAREAHACGLIARVVDHEALEAEAQRAVDEMLRCAPEARAQFKRIVNGDYPPIDMVTMEASIRGDECAEGFRAFTERRAPSWVPEELRDGRL
ncbi:MAG: enoyl-CoA hydratase/isomerase family protein [Acidimicrobiia bacterium]